MQELKESYQTGEIDDGISLSDTAGSMGDLDRLLRLTEALAPTVKDVVEMAVVQKRKTAELQSLMLKGKGLLGPLDRR